MKYVFAILTVLLLGCQDIKRPEKPKDLIPKEKMISILTEAYLANASQNVRNQAIFAQAIDLDSLIYAKFGIDSLQFKKSNDYYSFDFNTYIEMLSEVESNLEFLDKSLDSIREARMGEQINSEIEHIKRNEEADNSDNE